METGTTTPTLTVDAVIPRFSQGDTEILLIQRSKEPYQGMWALPGGTLDVQDATLQDAIAREVWEETHVGLNVFGWRQLYTFGDQGRDPRGRYVSVLYLAPLQNFVTAIQAGEDLSNVRWFPITELPPLAFDHALFVSLAVRALNSNVQVLGESTRSVQPVRRSASL